MCMETALLRTFNNKPLDRSLGCPDLLAKGLHPHIASVCALFPSINLVCKYSSCRLLRSLLHVRITIFAKTLQVSYL